MESTTPVRQSERSAQSWREALAAAQEEYEAAKSRRRLIARNAALAGFSKRQIAECMGIATSMVQNLTGLTGTPQPSLDAHYFGGGSDDVTVTLDGER
jgi:hypothetical protein